MIIKENKEYKKNENLYINSYFLKKIISYQKHRLIFFEELYFNFFKNDLNYNLNNKYKHLKSMILENGFLKKNQKEYLFNIFNIYQKNIFALKKLIFIYKWNKIEFFNNNHDLIGNCYDTFNNNQLITINQNNKKYKFRASDILNIWKVSLLNCNNMTPNPKIPRNPYSNIILKKHNLYNIYYHIKFNTILKIPNIIEIFFIQSFSIKLFLYMEYSSLFNNSIHEYVKNMSTETLFFEIKYMFLNNKLFKKYDLNFFNLDLEKANNLKHILNYYILSTHIIHPLKKKFYKKLFNDNASFYINKNKHLLRRYVITNI